MTTHSIMLVCRIPWTEDPGRPQSIGSQSRTLSNWTTTTCVCLFYFRLLVGEIMSYLCSVSPDTIYCFALDIVLASGNRTDTKTPALLILLKCMIYPRKSWLRCLRFVCLFFVLILGFSQWSGKKGKGWFLKLLLENSHDFLKWNFSRADRWIRGPHIWIPFPRSSHAVLCQSPHFASLSLAVRLTGNISVALNKLEWKNGWICLAAQSQSRAIETLGFERQKAALGVYPAVDFQTNGSSLKTQEELWVEDRSPMINLLYFPLHWV